MKINVVVIPNAKDSKVVCVDGEFRAYVKSVPVRGKANKELIEVLADYFKVRKTRVKILKGEKSRKKIVFINI